MIDLEYVESRQGLLRDDVPLVDTIGSQKVFFVGCELAISKLEPYLGKVLVDPPAGALGTTEWIGLCRTTDLPLEFVAYLLMLPDLCEAYSSLWQKYNSWDLNYALRVQLRRAEPRGTIGGTPENMG